MSKDSHAETNGELYICLTDILSTINSSKGWIQPGIDKENNKEEYKIIPNDIQVAKSVKDNARYMSKEDY